MYEDFFRGNVSAARVFFEGRGPRGEFVLVVDAFHQKNVKWTEANLNIAIEAGIAEGESPSALAKRLAKESGWARRNIYKRISLIK